MNERKNKQILRRSGLFVKMDYTFLWEIKRLHLLLEMDTFPGKSREHLFHKWSKHYNSRFQKITLVLYIRK